MKVIGSIKKSNVGKKKKLGIAEVCIAIEKNAKRPPSLLTKTPLESNLSGGTELKHYLIEFLALLYHKYV